MSKADRKTIRTALVNRAVYENNRTVLAYQERRFSDMFRDSEDESEMENEENNDDDAGDASHPRQTKFSAGDRPGVVQKPSRKGIEISDAWIKDAIRIINQYGPLEGSSGGTKDRKGQTASAKAKLDARRRMSVSDDELAKALKTAQPPAKRGQGKQRENRSSATILRNQRPSSEQVRRKAMPAPEDVSKQGVVMKTVDNHRLPETYWYESFLRKEAGKSQAEANKKRSSRKLPSESERVPIADDGLDFAQRDDPRFAEQRRVTGERSSKTQTLHRSGREFPLTDGALKKLYGDDEPDRIIDKFIRSEKQRNRLERHS